jgi:prephenate dehydratase
MKKDKSVQSGTTPAIHSLSVQPVVSIQGQPGSFHHLAAIQLFGDVPCLYRDSFREVFTDYAEKRANFMLIAIENSIAGSLIYNYDLIATYKVPIVAEIYLHIGQHLIAHPGTTLETLTEIWSHPMAIEQCRVFLQPLPVQIVEKADTAGSVREMRDEKRVDVGVISSRYSADLYGMEVIHPHVETDPNNYTRFLLLSNERISFTDQEPFKSTLWFGVPNKPGSLLRVLEVFDQADMNMTKLESRPSPGSVWSYDFFVDVSMDANSELGRATIAKASTHCSFMNVLGSYPEL